MSGSAVIKQGIMDVVVAARTRITNIFDSGLPVYMAFSGGKDSLTMAHITLGLIQSGLIDPKKLIVIFVDEEAIFPEVERVVMDWRLKFMLTGAEFRWYCLEVKYFNCFNQLENDESFICWDRNKRSTWIRDQPDFAIKAHELLNVGHDNYQAFFPRITRDGVQMIGTRIYESIQRALCFRQAMKKSRGRTPTNGTNAFFPIYDFADTDIWLYLKNNHIDFPIEYLYMWQIGVGKNHLRISQFFSIDTARSLVGLGEFYPGLMEKINKREPNAYLASLYWDSEMFRRTSSRRKKLEEGSKQVNYKAKVLNLLSDIDKNFDTPSKKENAIGLQRKMFQVYHMLIDKDWKACYDILVAGDPKQRAASGLYHSVVHRYAISSGANTGKGNDKYA